VSATMIEGYRLDAERARLPGLQLWQARSSVRDTPVLLQVWESADPRVRESIKALAAHRHPGLATVLDIGETADGRLYVAFADLPGPSFADQLRDGLDLPLAVASLRQLAQAGAHLEARAAPRADFDPQLILFDGRERPVLTRLQPDSAEQEAAHTLRQLGALFYEALCGEPLNAGAESPALPDYLQRWQPIIDGCLGSPGFADFNALLSALDQLEGRSSSATAKSNAAPEAQSKLPPSSAPKPSPPVARPPAADTDGEAAPQARPQGAQAPGRGPKAPAGVRADEAVTRARTALPPGAGAAISKRIEDDLRSTAPSRRVDPAVPVPPPRPGPSAPPPSEAVSPRPPSRLPLFAAAAVLGLGVLALTAMWALSPRAPEGEAVAVAPTPAPPPAPTAGNLARPASPSPQAPEREAPAGFQALDQVSAYELNPALEVEVSQLPTVVDPVEQFILFARTNLEAGRLVEPPQRNALERYLLALRIEPGNREAQAGIAAVGQRCVEQARTATEVDGLLAGLDCARKVATAHPAGQAAQADAAQLRQRVLDERVEAGQRALRQWRADEARLKFEQALRIAPEDPLARSGLEEAGRQGRPGYTFRDPLKDGGQGPELRVMAGLAWGRHEVSVAEFERFWRAGGQASLAGKLPSCRDRESLLRSSRKRSWQAPDIPQSAEHPVVCVNHAMAQAYIDWLSTQTGAPYRLPSRSEWQALAGSTPQPCAANFRDQAAASAWNAREVSACDDGHAYTAPTGAAGTQSGLLGLWGNVGEWLSDCDAGNCRERLVAGGSWYTPRDEAGVRGFAAEPGFTTIGFRVVRELPARAE
jgi:serine/threonine-protein kinase PpkA